MGTRDFNNPAGFDQLLRPHMELLYRLAFRLTGNKAEAEDLFQDVLTKIYVRLEELMDIDAPGPWLSRVMYNYFIDNKRKYARQRLVVVEEAQLPGESVELLADCGGPRHEAEREDDITQLESALARLSDEHRQVVLMHDVEGYKLKEIQEITGDPVGTLKSRLHRARARLRKFLEKEEPFAEPHRVRDTGR